MATTDETLTAHQAQIVRLIDAGFTRWKIAELIGTSEDAVRQSIRRLCQRFDCSMENLPTVIDEELWISRREET